MFILLYLLFLELCVPELKQNHTYSPPKQKNKPKHTKPNKRGIEKILKMMGNKT
jgi:hypothetical protein